MCDVTIDELLALNGKLFLLVKKAKTPEIPPQATVKYVFFTLYEHACMHVHMYMYMGDDVVLFILYGRTMETAMPSRV